MSRPVVCRRCGGLAPRWNATTCGACYAAIRHESVIIRADERFDARVDRSGGPEACWPRAGAHAAKGHSVFSMYGRNIVASRFALERALGREPAPGEYALHRCDNPPCVNPAHLFVGSIRDNNADAAKKGRMHEQLSADDVRALRAARAAGEPALALAARYSINHATVRKIAAGTKRPHVGVAS